MEQYYNDFTEQLASWDKYRLQVPRESSSTFIILEGIRLIIRICLAILYYQTLNKGK